MVPLLPRMNVREGDGLPTDEAGWIAIRSAYEDTEETLEAMAARFGVARSSISQHVKDKGWVSRRNAAAIDARSLIQRMYRLVEKVLVRMERASDSMTEKDAGILTRMAATVDRLIEIQARTPESPRRGTAAKESAEMQLIRDILAKRFEQLGDL